MARAASDITSARETEAQAAELAALLRLLDISAGTSSLNIAVCNSPALRDYLIGRVRESRSDLVVVALPRGCVDIYGEVVNMLTGTKPGAVFVTCIEHSVSSESKEHPTLKSLNASRDLWESRFPCPVIFWVPAYVAALLPVHAPDLWRYRSHGFEFVAPELSQGLISIQGYGGEFVLAANLDSDQRQFRIAELEQRVSDVGWPPPKSMVSAFAQWMSELGYLYMSLHEINKAEMVFQKALAISETEGWNSGVAIHSGNLGSAAVARDDLDSAERFFQKALDINLQLGRVDGQAVQLGNLGVVCKRRGNLNAAEDFFRQALDKARLTGHAEGQAIHLGNLGAVLATRGDLDSAERLFRDALALDERAGRIDGQAKHLRNLGQIAEKRGDLADARRLWSKALGILVAAGMTHEAADVKRAIDRLSFV